MPACRVAGCHYLVAGSPMEALKTMAEGTRSGVSGPDAQEWRGKFPYNELISLLDVNRPFNLAESTSQDLTLGELLDLAGLESIRDLKIGYGSSAGSIELARRSRRPATYQSTRSSRPKALRSGSSFWPSRSAGLATKLSSRHRASRRAVTLSLEPVSASARSSCPSRRAIS